MKVLSLAREIDSATLDPMIYARLLFSINDIPSDGEYAYKCRLIGEKIMVALEQFKEKKNG